MTSVTVAQIEGRLRQLPPEKLGLVIDFVDFLADPRQVSPALAAALAAECVICRQWNTPDEDAAWADL